MEWTYITHTVEETEAMAARLGQKVFPGAILALWGELGAGKTAFVRGLCRGMGITAWVSSPTFAIMHVYPGSTPVWHYDMYRLPDSDALDDLGVDEVWGTDGVTVMEWPERVADRLPAGRLDITVRYGAEPEDRIWHIASGDETHARMLEGMD